MLINKTNHTMKKTLNILGAAAISAVVLFGSVSCNGTKKNEGNTNSTETSAAPAGSIVFVDMTRIMAEYQMAIDLSDEVQKKIEELEKPLLNKKTAAEKELKRKQDNLQAKAKDFEDKYNKGHLTQTSAQVKMQEMQKLEEEYKAYGMTKEQELAQEGAKVQAQINDELLVMNNIVNDAINTFIQSYRAEKGYAMILDNQSDMDKEDKANVLNSLVLASDPTLDVTSDVIARLNAEYTPAK